MSLIAGLVYAGIHAIRATRVVAAAGEKVQSYLSAMSEPLEDESGVEPPLFTQPLSTAAHRYSLAQTVVEERRISRHNRHAKRWSNWKKRNLTQTPFNQDTKTTVTHSAKQDDDGSISLNQQLLLPAATTTINHKAATETL
ncbi:hypothetical protein FHX77_000184 [Bifidobacterium commune]|uniref:hypothetical protein n=1 Tax=Bifidobacterium commune TaxID=1505727 RepID=UPI0011780AD9|nr:hypothetical protein [Bifidobacterium commune]MBB2954804.1 hypothetical protein [Bifidobacterium commune]